MQQQTDKVFMKYFSLMVTMLIILAIVIIFIARIAGHKEYEPVSSKVVTTVERLKPVSGVYTSEAGVAAVQQATAAVSAEPKVAFDGSLDGEMIYGAVCAACHATAVLGAPQPGSPEMATRAAEGMDVMMGYAINGLNAMPARGGRPDLSDEQIHAVIEFMLK